MSAVLRSLSSQSVAKVSKAFSKAGDEKLPPGIRKTGLHAATARARTTRSGERRVGVMAAGR